MSTHCKGNIIIEDIKIGDVHYEYESGFGIKCEVTSKPVINDDGNWTWNSKNVKTGQVIEYLVNPDYPHYGPNIYDHMAYTVARYL